MSNPSYEAPPKRGPGRPPKNGGSSGSDAAYDWLNGQADKNAILAHARRKGVPVPPGLHLNSEGGSAIGEDGIRRIYIIKEDSNQGNYALRQRYISKGYEVKEDSDGVGYHISIPQTLWESNQRDIIARYDRQRKAGERKVQENGELEDYALKASRISKEELLADAFGDESAPVEA